MNILDIPDHISMESTSKEFLPQMILAAIEKIGYRISQLALGPSRSTMIIAHPDTISCIGVSWEQYLHCIEFFPDESITDRAYVLTTHINTRQVLDYKQQLGWEEFLNALQDFFDGKPRPLTVTAPWAQAILIVTCNENNLTHSKEGIKNES